MWSLSSLQDLLCAKLAKAVLPTVSISFIIEFDRSCLLLVRSDELMVAMLRATIDRMPVKPAEVEDICVGIVQGASNTLDARAAALTAGFRMSSLVLPARYTDYICSRDILRPIRQPLLFKWSHGHLDHLQPD